MSILSEVTQLVDGVDVVSAKDIMDTQETAISAIKKADEALDKANNMSGGNEYDDTELRGLIDNKANLDASNLSTSNVSSWKSKLGVPSSSVSPLDSYPVGALYISTSSTSPASLFGGTWSQITAGYALWTATSGAGGTIAAGLPNITGSALVVSGADTTASGAMSKSGQVDVGPTGTGSGWQQRTVSFNASSSNSIYGKSSTVQPPAYKVYAWKRTA